jgi:hypothetical protein
LASFHTQLKQGVNESQIKPAQKVRCALANKSPTILLFIPAESDTKADAMDDKQPGIINEQRSRSGGQHD